MNKTDEGAMAEDRRDDAQGPRPSPQQQPQPHRDRGDDRGGFFAIYKSGHGYWTRMGTAAGAALLGALTAHFVYEQLPILLGDNVARATARNIAIAAAAGFLVLYALLVWWLLNKPRNADFLIATDGEMKRVNWTSRKELIGSTKVVIVFMFLVAAFLFIADLAFSTFFYLINVLKIPPFFLER